MGWLPRDPSDVGLDPSGYTDGQAPVKDPSGGFVPSAVVTELPDETVFAPAYTVDTTGTIADITLTVVWGVDVDGEPYYNAAGVTAGQEAVLVLNNTTGKFALRPVEV